MVIKMFIGSLITLLIYRGPSKEPSKIRAELERTFPILTDAEHAKEKMYRRIALPDPALDVVLERACETLRRDEMETLPSQPYDDLYENERLIYSQVFTSQKVRKICAGYRVQCLRTRVYQKKAETQEGTADTIASDLERFVNKPALLRHIAGIECTTDASRQLWGTSFRDVYQYLDDTPDISPTKNPIKNGQGYLH